MTSKFLQTSYKRPADSDDDSDEDNCTRRRKEYKLSQTRPAEKTTPVGTATIRITRDLVDHAGLVQFLKIFSRYHHIQTKLAFEISYQDEIYIIDNRTLEQVNRILYDQIATRRFIRVVASIPPH